MLLFISVM